MTTHFYAHAPYDKKANPSPSSRTWNPLAKHLKNVGELAACFALPQMKEISQYAGQWHDLGKYRTEFQQYLKGQRPSSHETHHAAYGAALAEEYNLKSVVFAIAGHHAGLHNSYDLQKLLEDYPTNQCLPHLKERFLKDGGRLVSSLQEPEFAVKDNDVFVYEFYVRMLFSCLTDADVIDAKRFSRGEKQLPTPHILNHHKMIGQLNEHMKTLGQDRSVLNQIRQDVHEQCQKAASGSQGFFQLTVPTGGGKTLSAMRFALEHAQIHQLNRIIVVIPYLSIIEQNAEVYRHIFTDPNTVIEHHCAVKEPQHPGEPAPSAWTQCAENWDAPIVVTTTVQFIESLFSHSPRRCRKLHNIARSVVLLDEVHTLPHHLLDPLLNVIRQLTTHYKTTIVLSTATQPAFHQSPHLKNGFSDEDQIRQIIHKPQKLYSQLSRVNGRFINQNQSWQQLTDTWHQKHNQALGMVNTKAQARDWYRVLTQNYDKKEVFHLSSALCPEHRQTVLKHVQNRCVNSQRCYLISTQVVESGVDIDFPAVYRALAPLDSLIQAAGRCNRHNKLTDQGQLVVFIPQNPEYPSGVYKPATMVTHNFLKSYTNNGRDLNDILTDSEVFADYFSRLWPYIAQNDSSADSIQQHREKLHYREVSKKAKVIDDDGTPVVVPYGQAQVLVDKLKNSFQKSGTLKKQHVRSLQRYMVNLRAKEFQRAKSNNQLHEILSHGSLYMLDSTAYHPDLGAVIH